MQTRQILFILVMGATSVTAACDGSAGVTTAAPEDSRLSALTGDTLSSFCQDVSGYAADWSARPELQRGQCRYTSALRATWSGAATDAQLQGDCARRYSTCLALGAGSIAAAPRCAFPATCQATVGQYTACLHDITDALDEMAAATPACEQLTVSGDTALPTFTLPDSCKTYDTLCPAAAIGPTPGSTAGTFELHF